MIRPGPPSVAPGLCPGGVIIHVYAVPSEVLVATHPLRLGDDVEGAATAAGAIFGTYTSEAACLVAYDGDTGERYPRDAWTGEVL